jgi:hypothetical protein
MSCLPSWERDCADNMEHEVATDFIVNPPVENQNLSFRAECIKNAEPFVREHGRTIEWDKFNSLVSDGSLEDVISGDAEKIQSAMKKLTE